MFAFSRLPSLLLKLTHLRCQPGVFPSPRCHDDQHSVGAIRSEDPDMTDHLERGRATQTWLFSQLWYAKHTKSTPAKGPISVARCLVVHTVRTQRSSVQLLRSGRGPMQCVYPGAPQRNSDPRKQRGEARRPLAALENVHTLFLFTRKSTFPNSTRWSSYVSAFFFFLVVRDQRSSAQKMLARSSKWVPAR